MLLGFRQNFFLLVIGELFVGLGCVHILLDMFGQVTTRHDNGNRQIPDVGQAVCDGRDLMLQDSTIRDCCLVLFVIPVS